MGYQLNKNTSGREKMEIIKNGSKFEAVHNGRVLARSTVRASARYHGKRKLALAVSNSGAETKPSPQEFGINKRFDFVDKLVSMVASKKAKSVIISGPGGLGKTYSVMSALTKAGLKDLSSLADVPVGSKLDLSKCFRFVKGYSTAKGLYRTLYEGSSMTLVFDDCDSVLKDPVALNLLKSALDSFGKRYISWNAETRGDDSLPTSFEFKGQIVFITNVDLDRLDQAVKSRSMCIDLTMSQDDKLERMEKIAFADEFLPGVDLEAKKDALDFLKSKKDDISDLNLRSLIQVTNIANSGDTDWRDLAKYVISQGQ
jgi:hypothetical protein